MAQRTAFLLALTAAHLLTLLAQEIDINTVLPADYNPDVRPGYSLQEPLNISITVYVNDLVSADDKGQSIQLDIILIQEWTDSRLLVSQIGSYRQLTVTKSSSIQKFWLPELYLINGASASVVKAFEAVQKLTINSDGLLSFVQRVNAKLSCPMNLQNFPHDFQYCRIQISTLIYNQSEIRLIWKSFDAFSGDYPLFLIRYWYTSVECEGGANPIPENACISGTLKLVRRLSYYIIRYYLLTFLCAAIATVQFWVPVNAWPARITLLVNPLLNLITQDISINNEIGVYYVVSFHWWMMWLQGIVYLEIVEYAVAISWAHFITDKKYHAQLLEKANNNAQDGKEPIPVPPAISGYYFGNNGLYRKIGIIVDKVLYFFFGPIDYHLDPFIRNKIDYACRIIFLFFFLLFVLLYVLITTIYWAANYM